MIGHRDIVNSDQVNELFVKVGNLNLKSLRKVLKLADEFSTLALLFSIFKPFVFSLDNFYIMVILN